MTAKFRLPESVGVMMFVAVVALVGLAMLLATPSLLVDLFPIGKVPVAFHGDSTALGARIFVDDELMGTMKGLHVGGHVTPTLTGELSLGPHRVITAVSAQGETLVIPFPSGEFYGAYISFGPTAMPR